MGTVSVAPPWATETVLSPLDGGWWGYGIARAFTRCMMKINHLFGHNYMFPSKWFNSSIWLTHGLVVFYILNLEDYLMPNPVYIYIYIYIYIYEYNLKVTFLNKTEFVWLVVWVLWCINLCRLFNAKFCLYVYTFNQRFLNEY